jgi:hypothetical protein
MRSSKPWRTGSRPTWADATGARRSSRRPYRAGRATPIEPMSGALVDSSPTIPCPGSYITAKEHCCNSAQAFSAYTLVLVRRAINNGRSKSFYRRRWRALASASLGRARAREPSQSSFAQETMRPHQCMGGARLMFTGGADSNALLKQTRREQRAMYRHDRR